MRSVPGKNLFAVVNSVVTEINYGVFDKLRDKERSKESAYVFNLIFRTPLMYSDLDVQSSMFHCVASAEAFLRSHFLAVALFFFIGGAAFPLIVRLKKPKELLHETHAKESFPSL